MKGRSGCTKMGIGFALLLSALGLVAVLAFTLLQYASRQQSTSNRFRPPSVMLSEPTSKTPVFAGSYIPVIATAFGDIPTTRIELWMDGELVDEARSPQAEGISPFHADFSLLLPEGSHMLFVRAVDRNGLIGRSLPVSIVAGPKPGSNELFYPAVVNPGESLADIASRFSTDPNALRQANPELGGTEPPAGSMVKVPVPTEQENPEPGPTSISPPGSNPIAIPDNPMLKETSLSPLIRFPAWKLPAAPTDLQAQVKDCQVTLRWTDNAANEERYEVWFAGVGLPSKLIAALKPTTGGTAWYQFPAPQVGYLSFWVEAANNLGGQPSNPAWVFIESNCPGTLAKQLQVELLDITVSGGYNRVYCYVSFESAPEIRLPKNSNDFIQVQAGKGEIASWTVEDRIFTIFEPKDGSLDVSGECLGWSGDTLDKLGTFSASLDAGAWDGVRRQLEGGTFQIGIAAKRLKAADDTGVFSTFGFDDPTAPQIYQVVYEHVTDPGAWTACAPECYFLRWDTKPGSREIEWWDIYVELMSLKPPKGYLLRSMPNAGKTLENGLYRVGTITLGPDSYCNEKSPQLKWKVVGHLEGGGDIVGYRVTTVECPKYYYVYVKFDTLEIPWTGEGIDPGPCDTLDVYYWIRVNNQSKSFWGGNFFQNIRCGKYTFKELASPTNDPEPDEIWIRYLSTVPPNLDIVTMFYDYDTVGSDDLFGAHIAHYSSPSQQAAEQELECNGKSFSTDMYVNDTADTRLYYTVKIRPNPCTPSEYRP